MPSVEGLGARKAALRQQVQVASPEALAIYAADKLAKTRELRAMAAREHISITEPAVTRRLAHYEASLALLEAAAPDFPTVAQLRFELWALRRLPPG